MLDLTPLLRLYAGYRRHRLAARDPIRVQRSQLEQLLRRAGRTRFGREHGFERIQDVQGYQARVPIRDYERFWDDYWRDAFPEHRDLCWPGLMPFFALSSGTSKGTTKYIPCSDAMCRSNNRAAWDVLVQHVHNRPSSQLLGGVSLMLGGSTDLSTLGPGVRAGDLSGIAAYRVPSWLAGRVHPPLELAHLSDWERKMDAIARGALDLDIRTISGTPSWLLVLFDRLRGLRPAGDGSLAELFPNLELVVHGGVNFAPYRQRFEQLLEGSHAELREVYAASEGFFALADAGPEDGLRLCVDSGIFYEFVPLECLGDPDPPRHWLADIQTGVDYAIVVSTCAGLWSYLVGDLVRFVQRDPPRLLVTGRTSYMLSAFGEHLIEIEIETAVAEAAADCGLNVVDFSVGAIYPEREAELGRHLYIVEFDPLASDPQEVPDAALGQRFIEIVDRRLMSANDDYRAHRADGFGLASPELRVVPPGTFAAWMKARGKLGGQNKVPRVINEPRLWQHLRDHATTTTGSHDRPMP
ncbi:MAG: GH3 auxin-responsive promoter family protein [Gammaproteobacteria bacterium]|nr:GH3 auxin-responsive promoter family protein [Gammaproteobacteria bacterium]